MNTRSVTHFFSIEIETQKIYWASSFQISAAPLFDFCILFDFRFSKPAQKWFYQTKNCKISVFGEFKFT